MPLVINAPEIVAEVAEAFDRYERALVGNDVKALDALFWNSPYTIRFGATEDLYGIAEIRDFRQSRPSQGLARALRRTVITTFGRDFATASTEFTRAGVAAIGRQQQSWARTGEGWRIVAAHVSLMGPQP